MAGRTVDSTAATTVEQKDCSSAALRAARRVASRVVHWAGRLVASTAFQSVVPRAEHSAARSAELKVDLWADLMAAYLAQSLAGRKAAPKVEQWAASMAFQLVATRVGCSAAMKAEPRVGQ